MLHPSAKGSRVLLHTLRDLQFYHLVAPSSSRASTLHRLSQGVPHHFYPHLTGEKIHMPHLGAKGTGKGNPPKEDGKEPHYKIPHGLCHVAQSFSVQWTHSLQQRCSDTGAH